MILVAGYNKYRQLIVESNDKDNKPRVNPPQTFNIGSNIRSFSTYRHHSVKISEDGQAYGIGKDNNFRIGTPNRVTYDSFTKVTFDDIPEKFISAHCGVKFTLYVTESSRLVLCSEDDRDKIPRIFYLKTKPVSLFGSGFACAIIDENGDLYTINPSRIFGDIQRNLPGEEFYHLSPSIHYSSPVKAVSIRPNFLISLTEDGNLYFSSSKRIEISLLNKNAKVTNLFGTGNSCFVIDSDNNIYGYSIYRKYNLLGIENEESFSRFVYIDSLSKYKINSVYTGISHTFFVTDKKELLACGSNLFKQLMVPTFTDIQTIDPIKVSLEKFGSPEFVIAGNVVSVVFLNFAPKHCPNRINNLIINKARPKRMSLKGFKPKVIEDSKSLSFNSSSPETKTHTRKDIPKAEMNPKGSSVPSSPIKRRESPQPFKGKPSSKTLVFNDDDDIKPPKKSPKIEDLNSQVETLKKQNAILIKLLKKKSKNDHKCCFLEPEKFDELVHVKYLSKTDIVDQSQVKRETDIIEYFNLKKFKSDNFKKFQKFFRQYELISSIIHPSIIKFIGYSNVAGSIRNPLLLVEYLPYNLREIMSKKVLSNTDKVKMIVDIAAGMKFLQENKEYMHRNLKPENILVSKKFHAKIGDFSWANVIDIDIIYSKKEMKSLSYMAPEMFDSDDYNEKVDQYAFGKIVYFILSDGCDPPFKMEDIENGKTYARLPSFNDLASDLMEKTCSYDPESRPLFSEIIDKIVHGNFMLLPGVDSNAVQDRLLKIQILETVNNE